jgi:hypothetical protein
MDTKLVSETHARLARTRQTLVDLICYGFDSPEGSAAIQRLRDVHRDLKVSCEDYQYVLATFFLEPLRWSEQHGLKAVTQDEANLLLGFWMQVGHAMSIPNPPASLQEPLRSWGFAPLPAPKNKRLMLVSLDNPEGVRIVWSLFAFPLLSVPILFDGFQTSRQKERSGSPLLS